MICHRMKSASIAFFLMLAFAAASSSDRNGNGKKARASRRSMRTPSKRTDRDQAQPSRRRSNQPKNRSPRRPRTPPCRPPLDEIMVKSNKEEQKLTIAGQLGPDNTKMKSISVCMLPHTKNLLKLTFSLENARHKIESQNIESAKKFSGRSGAEKPSRRVSKRRAKNRAHSLSIANDNVSGRYKKDKDFKIKMSDQNLLEVAKFMVKAFEKEKESGENPKILGKLHTTLSDIFESEEEDKWSTDDLKTGHGFNAVRISGNNCNVTPPNERRKEISFTVFASNIEFGDYKQLCQERRPSHVTEIQLNFRGNVTADEFPIDERSQKKSNRYQKKERKRAMDAFKKAQALGKELISKIPNSHTSHSSYKPDQDLPLILERSKDAQNALKHAYGKFQGTLTMGYPKNIPKPKSGSVGDVNGIRDHFQRKQAEEDYIRVFENAIKKEDKKMAETAAAQPLPELDDEKLVEKREDIPKGKNPKKRVQTTYKPTKNRFKEENEKYWKDINAADAKYSKKLYEMRKQPPKEMAPTSNSKPTVANGKVWTCRPKTTASTLPTPTSPSAPAAPHKHKSKPKKSSNGSRPKPVAGTDWWTKKTGLPKWQPYKKKSGDVSNTTRHSKAPSRSNMTGASSKTGTKSSIQKLLDDCELARKACSRETAKAKKTLGGTSKPSEI